MVSVNGTYHLVRASIPLLFPIINLLIQELSMSTYHEPGLERDGTYYIKMSMTQPLGPISFPWLLFRSRKCDSLIHVLE